MKNNKYKKIIGIAFVVLLTILNIILIKNNNIIGPYEVTDIVDGDTIWINIDGEREKIRLLCIDTPESVHSDESKNTEEGKIASNILKDLIGNSKVYLEFDEAMYDQYGRSLCYVYLEDKKTMLNAEMIKLGYAKAVVYGPNDKYYDRFCLYENEAKLMKKGLWGTGFYE